jgi:hypothetical protein
MRTTVIGIWLIVMSATNLFAQADSRAANGGHVLCRDKGTMDSVQPVPRSLEAFVDVLYGEDSASTSVYRCMNGVAYVCLIGNDFSCDQPSSDRHNPGAENYCRENPGAPFVPMADSGHGTIYTWKCVGRHAAIDSIEKLDERGFRADMWTAAPGAN